MHLHLFTNFCFNQYDPFEDTESVCDCNTDNHFFGFNQYDPFEDTESVIRHSPIAQAGHVSTNTIRSRILKDNTMPMGLAVALRFNQYDPFEDTESQVRVQVLVAERVFQPIRSVRGY